MKHEELKYSKGNSRGLKRELTDVSPFERLSCLPQIADADVDKHDICNANISPSVCQHSIDENAII